MPSTGARGYVSEHDIRAADSLARLIATLDGLVEMRRVFETEARDVGPRVAAVRERLFEVRIDPTGIDSLIDEIDVIRDDVEYHSNQLKRLYSQASASMRPAPAEADPRVSGR